MYVTKPLYPRYSCKQLIVDVFTIRRRRIGEGWEKVPTRVLLIGAFNQQKALVGAFSMIVKTPGPTCVSWG